MKRWISIAMRREIVINSLKICVVVGTILVLINYFDQLLTGNLSKVDYIKMLFTYCVPYCVSTYASVSVVIGENT